jgi:triacylglycerol esterase/lipase EstA (alpha/beta hydrolase family)
LTGGAETVRVLRVIWGRLAWVLIGAMVLGCGLYVAGSYLLSFLIWPSSTSGRSPSLHTLLRAALLEFAASLAVAPFAPLWFLLGASYQAAVGADGLLPEPRRKRPVILLHGFALNRTQWLWMGSRLARRGLGPLYGATYFSFQSIRRSARGLAIFVEEIRQREQVEHVDIVAHSMGGLVARYYIERMEGARRVGRLVTLGSPHRGTALSRLLLLLIPGTRDLAITSALYTELSSCAPEVEYTTIWSRADAIIVPPESASLAPAAFEWVFEDLGHLSLVFSPRVIEAVAGCLAA